MSWTMNPIMEWSLDGTTWTKVTEHGRSPLSVTIERIENKNRMVDGTLRKYVVAKKRTFSVAWENLPDKDVDFLADLSGGTHGGVWIEEFHNVNDDAFYLRLRAGSDQDLETLSRVGGITDSDNERIFLVMISDFSKEVPKRGPAFDLWNLDITLEEV